MKPNIVNTVFSLKLLIALFLHYAY